MNKNKHIFVYEVYVYRSYNIVYYKLQIIYYNCIHTYMIRLMIAIRQRMTNRNLGTN